MSTVSDQEMFDRLGSPGRMYQIAGYDIFRPELRPRLNAIATRTAERLNAPLSMISVVLDTAQFILGHHGVPAWVAEIQGVPAEWSLCCRTVLAGEPYCIADTAAEPALADNPMLTLNGVGSYAGVPLTDGSGEVLGAHCVIDGSPRVFTEQDIAVLHEEAREAMSVLAEYRTA